MKKILILSIAALLFASCGKSGYNTVTRNNNNSSVAPSSTDPAAKFNTIWIADASSVTVSDQEKRAIANFFGYNTAHYANIAVQGHECYYGYTDESTTYYIPNYTAPCFDSGNFLKNYFTPTSPFINLFPAPIDIDSISSYKIRFAADVNDAREVVPDSAYLQIIIDTASDTLSRELVTMKASVNVAPASTTICSLGGQTIKASWKDGCGTVVFHADVCDGADHDKLQNVAITFKQDQASYKKASCYYDGRLPVSSIDIQRNDEITNALPGGLSASTVDNGNANLLKDNPIVDLIEQ